MYKQLAKAFGAGCVGALAGCIASLFEVPRKLDISNAVSGALAGFFAASLLVLSVSAAGADGGETTIKRIKKVHGVAAPMARYSQAVEIRGAKRLLYISGQTGHAVDGNLIGDSIEEQADLCFSNIKATLLEVGLTIDDLVKITVYLRSRDYLATYRTARDRAFGKVEPASTLVIAKLVHPDMAIEIDAVAAM
mmetsp:Transcript_27158/g.33294  ORF Transcript_27158/g.33294 Transcript_27158/m.33294 type:complete len:193 (+) Transcript_27158:45-623(+)